LTILNPAPARRWLAETTGGRFRPAVSGQAGDALQMGQQIDTGEL
jgi:hypothetical protein